MNVTNDLFIEAMSHYTVNAGIPWIFTPCRGGINNIVFYVDVSSQYDTSQELLFINHTKFVLRLYNNGRNESKVMFEHRVLSLIKQNSSSIASPFQFPELIHSMRDNKSYIILSNGAIAALWSWISGSLPDSLSSNIASIGASCAITSMTLRTISSQMSEEEIKSCPNPPYFKLFSAHHAITRELFYELVSSSTYDSVRAPMDYLTSQIKILEQKIEIYHTYNLPKHIIHGDLHYNNVLIDKDQVSAVLDFEFAAYDWRAMDLAINIACYCAEPYPLNYINEFMIGYSEHCSLTQTEVSLIPDLIKLRILNNVVYFVSRAHSKEDSAESIISRSLPYQRRLEFLSAFREEIVMLISSHLQKRGNLLSA